MKKGIKLKPLIFGGEQENGFRAGTENGPAIVGLAKAISLIDKKENIRITKLRNYFIDGLVKALTDAKINGPLENRLPGNVNISIPGLDSENLLIELDKHGISASSGSACTSHAVESSHVLKAIGLEEKYLSGALRFSLGRNTTKKDIDYVLKVTPKIVGELRKRYKK
jgi:cysteine desulfurase